MADVAAAHASNHADEPLVYESIGNGVDSKQITPKDTAIVKCVVAHHVACTACPLHRSISKEAYRSHERCLAGVFAGQSQTTVSAWLLAISAGIGCTRDASVLPMAKTYPQTSRLRSICESNAASIFGPPPSMKCRRFTTVRFKWPLRSCCCCCFIVLRCPQA